MSMEKSADLLSSNPQADNVPTGDDKVGDGGVKQFLMQAWQNLAMYVAATEEPEGAAAGMMLLQGLRHLISGENLAEVMGGQPQQPGQPPLQPGQQPQQPNDPNAAPQQQQQQMQNPQQQQQQVQDPNAAPTDPNQQQPQQSPFANPVSPRNAQPAGPAGPAAGGPAKKSASKKPPAKKTAKKAAKKKPATATAAMEWLLEAAASYGCATCDRSFGTEAGLRTHLKNMHSPKEA